MRAGMWESLRERGFSGELVRDVLGDKARVQESVAPRIWYLAAEAYCRDLLSEGQIAKKLGMDRVDVRAMLDDTVLEGLEAEALNDFEPVEATDEHDTLIIRQRSNQHPRHREARRHLADSQSETAHR